MSSLTIFDAVGRGHGGESHFAGQPAAEPTDACPGSEDKILTLIQRIERGEELWHPNDRTHLIDSADSWTGRLGSVYCGQTEYPSRVSSSLDDDS